MSKTNRNASSKERPSLFRALGNSDPPALIEVDRVCYRRIRIIKHDSWAATALYAPQDGQAARNIVCKFNRTEPVGWLPMKWLGRKLAHREYQMYHLLADLPGIAKGYREIYSGGVLQHNACGHEFIDGHPLRWHDFVNDDFFNKLDACLVAMHRRNVAYVDMHKSENIIVNEQGDPCLIDFQISMRWNSILLRLPLRILQRSDLYHSFKLRRRFRPDLLNQQQEFDSRIPWWIRAHRAVATPFRLARRRLLVALGIRKGKGMCQSETFIEEALIASGGKDSDEKPILRLYRLLRSESYLRRCGSSDNYVSQMIEDLLDGSLRPVDAKMIRNTKNATLHYKAIALLKSKTFVLASSHWSEVFVEQKIAKIEELLARSLAIPANSGFDVGRAA